MTNHQLKWDPESLFGRVNARLVYHIYYGRRLPNVIRLSA